MTRPIPTKLTKILCLMKTITHFQLITLKTAVHCYQEQVYKTSQLDCGEHTKKMCKRRLEDCDTILEVLNAAEDRLLRSKNLSATIKLSVSQEG